MKFVFTCMSFVTEITFLIIGAVIGFGSSAGLSVFIEKREMKKQEEKLLQGIYATVRFHQKSLDENASHLPLNRKFFNYLYETGAITLLTTSVMTMIIQYDNIVRNHNHQLELTQIVKDFSQEVKSVGNSMLAYIEKDYPEMKEKRKI